MSWLRSSKRTYLRNSTNLCCNRIKVSSSIFTYANNSGNFTENNRANTQNSKSDTKKTCQDICLKSWNFNKTISIPLMRNICMSYKHKNTFKPQTIWFTILQLTISIPNKRNKCSAPYIVDGDVLSEIASRYCRRSFLYKRIAGNALSK